MNVSDPRPVVCHICTHLGGGGAQRRLLTLLQHARDAEWRPVLIAGPGCLSERARETLGADFIELPSLVRRVTALSDIRALRDLRRALSRLSPALVHTHTPKAGLLGRLGAASLRLPVVHTVHGSLLYRGAPVIRTLALCAAELLCRPLTRHWIPVGKDVRERAAKVGWLTRSRSTVVYCTHDLRRIRESAGTRLALPPMAGETAEAASSDAEENSEVARPNVAESERRRDARQSAKTTLSLPAGPLLLWCGLLERWKAPVEAIEALALIADHPWTLAFVGTGPEEAAVRRAIAQHGLHDRVLLVGHREDVDVWFAAASMLVLTSHSEGLPGVAVEAAAAGLPVVSYPVDGVREVVRSGQTGFVTSRRDPNQLAAAVRRYLSDEALRSAHGRAAAAVDRFCLRTTVDEHGALYRRLGIFSGEP